MFCTELIRKYWEDYVEGGEPPELDKKGNALEVGGLCAGMNTAGSVLYVLITGVPCAD